MSYTCMYYGSNINRQKKNAAERKGIYFPVNLLHTALSPLALYQEVGQLELSNNPCVVCVFLCGCVFLILSIPK